MRGDGGATTGVQTHERRGVLLLVVEEELSVVHDALRLREQRLAYDKNHVAQLGVVGRTHGEARQFCHVVVVVGGELEVGGLKHRVAEMDLREGEKRSLHGIELEALRSSYRAHMPP